MNIDFDTVVKTIVGVAVGIGGAILTLRRKISRDNLEVSKDGAGQTLIQSLISERDRYAAEAGEAWDRRVADAEKIARLTAQNDALTERVRDLGDRDLSQKLKISNLRRALAESKPGALDDLDSNYAPIE